MTFWLVTGICTLFIAGSLIAVLLRHRASGEAADYDLRVYRDQLREVDRDLARGVIEADDANRIRTEISRRILKADADREAATTGPGRRTNLIAAALVAVIVAGGGYWGYLELGAPGHPDLGLKTRAAIAERNSETRASQAEAEAALPPQPSLAQPDAEFARLLTRLRETVAARPDDLQGQTLLARNEAALGNMRAARAAQAEVIALKGDDATVQDHAQYLDYLVAAADGYVSPEAEAVIDTILEMDPQNGGARYYAGLLQGQIGRLDRTFVIWRDLLEQSRPDAPWVPSIRAQIEDLAARAGVRYSLPPEEREAMIRQMVDGLASRLATDGGPPQDWARLIRALGVLGQTDRAAAIWQDAQTVFADADIRAPILEAARAAGVAE